MAISEKVAPLDEETAPPHHSNFLKVADVVLRFLLFALSLVAVVVAVTSKQTEQVSVIVFPLQSPILVSVPAKFNYTPAIIYMVVALSVAGLYSIITAFLSFSSLLNKLKPGFSTKLLSHFVISDLLLFGILTSATGAAGSISYTGIKGNSHIGWQKVCGTFDKFCWRVGSSIVLSFFASAVLLLLVLISIYDLSKKNRK